MMSTDNDSFREAVDDSLRRHVEAVNKCVEKGMHFWDYGNSFLLSAGRAGASVFQPGLSEGSFRHPSYVEDIMGDIFSLGFCPFRWVCTSACPQAAEAKGCYADNLAWIQEAGPNELVVGSQARILYADAKARVDIALALNSAVGDGTLIAPVVISRDHHDVSGVDSPWRETSNIKDGSRFCADMAVHNFVGDGFRGATLVALHNGGGTGFGEAMNGGFCLVLDGSADAARRASMMLHWDVFNGVARRAWDGNDNANLTITSEMEKKHNFRITRIAEADSELLDRIVVEDSK